MADSRIVIACSLTSNVEINSLTWQSTNGLTPQAATSCLTRSTGMSKHAWSRVIPPGISNQLRKTPDHDAHVRVDTELETKGVPRIVVGLLTRPQAR